MRSPKACWAGLALLTIALAACSGSNPTTTPPSGTANTSRSTASLSPLTGLKAELGRPVLAVKIDDVAPARPQTGLTRADVIYIEPVEGGLSRMLAIFSAHPVEAGPVRSARESDLDLLKQYGPVGFVYSGANKGVLQSIKNSDLVRLSPDQASSAYSRRGPHVAPHNLYVNLPGLAKRAGLATAHDVGFRFGELPVGGQPAKRTTVRYGAATTSFTWNAGTKRWNVSLDSRTGTTTDGGKLAPATVVVQDVTVTQSKYHDVLGNPTPYTETVGAGTATVLRNGQAFSARWSRPSASGGTTYTTTAGAPMLFAPGQLWIVFRKAA